MAGKPNGELVPVGGGDPIPLTRRAIKIGRRDTCDVVLRYANVSGQHCALEYIDGYWHLTDLDSTNGVKVNGVRVKRRVLKPGDEVAIAKHKFTIEFTPDTAAGSLLEIYQEDEENLEESLLEKAGLEKKRKDPDGDSSPDLRKKPGTK
jgi:adenylate cyclase